MSVVLFRKQQFFCVLFCNEYPINLFSCIYTKSGHTEQLISIVLALSASNKSLLLNPDFFLPPAAEVSPTDISSSFI